MYTRMFMELSSYLVRWVVTYLGDIQPNQRDCNPFTTQLLSSTNSRMKLNLQGCSHTCKNVDHRLLAPHHTSRANKSPISLFSSHVWEISIDGDTQHFAVQGAFHLRAKVKYTSSFASYGHRHHIDESTIFSYSSLRLYLPWMSELSLYTLWVPNL